MTLRIDPTGDDRAEFLAILEFGLSPLIREDARPLRGFDDVLHDVPLAVQPPSRIRFRAEPGFVRVGPRSRKVRCVTCGAKGYPNSPWQTSHRLGHPHECVCGRVFSTLYGIARHRRWEADTNPGSPCITEPV